MSPKTGIGRPALGTIVTLVVVALVIVAGVWFFVSRTSGTRYSAVFTTTVGLYPQADVRILGVPVGSVDAIEPQGSTVRVEFHVDSDYQLPADAKAVLVTPTVIGDRYLQITPVHTGGPELPAGGVIPNDRTASPAEYDDLLAAAQQLAVDLGPQGVNKDGALSQALSTLARNVGGNGRRLNTTLDNASQAITTLSASRDDLAGTVRGLQSFTTNLKANDPQVRAFTQQFAQVSRHLAGEREDLGAALHELSGALGEVATFVRDNRDKLSGNVDQIADVLDTVNANRLQLDQVLDTAPLALDGLVNAYNGAAGTLDTRANLVPGLLCSLSDKLPGGVGDPLKTQLARALRAKSASDPCIGIGTLPLPPMSSSQANAMMPLLRAALPVLPGHSAAPEAAAPRSLPGLFGIGR